MYVERAVDLTNYGQGDGQMYQQGMLLRTDGRTMLVKLCTKASHFNLVTPLRWGEWDRGEQKKTLMLLRACNFEVTLRSNSFRLCGLCDLISEGYSGRSIVQTFTGNG